MKTKCRVGYHFFTPLSLKGRLVALLGLSPVSHIVISVHPEGQDIHYYQCGWGQSSTWSVGELGVSPYDSLYEDLDIDINVLNLLLPRDEEYSLQRVSLNYMLGMYRHTLSCVSCVHRVRFLGNRDTTGRTPGGIYKHLRQTVHNQ